ncbi:hypothetical protein MMC07_007892 [Pseudocyphellaria aurata]|nr:hypothetical protein [Pseudocyphellaria aurata]
MIWELFGTAIIWRSDEIIRSISQVRLHQVKVAIDSGRKYCVCDESEKGLLRKIAQQYVYHGKNLMINSKVIPEHPLLIAKNGTRRRREAVLFSAETADASRFCFEGFEDPIPAFIYSRLLQQALLAGNLAPAQNALEPTTKLQRPKQKRPKAADALGEIDQFWFDRT